MSNVAARLNVTRIFLCLRFQRHTQMAIDVELIRLFILLWNYIDFCPLFLRYNLHRSNNVSRPRSAFIWVFDFYIVTRESNDMSVRNMNLLSRVIVNAASACRIPSGKVRKEFVTQRESVPDGFVGLQLVPIALSLFMIFPYTRYDHPILPTFASLMNGPPSDTLMMNDRVVYL